MVPEWVAYSAYGPGEWAHPPVGPRFVRVRQGPLPHALQGVRNLFRQGVAPCRCVVPSVLPRAVEDVLMALSEASRFAELLAYYIGAYSCGSVGVNMPMRAALASSQCCWNWEQLVRSRPQAQHYKAVLELYKLLLPSLKSTHWPSFAWLPKQWPMAHGILQQYRLLMQRVRAVWRDHPAVQSAWLSQASFEVEAVRGNALQVSLGVWLQGIPCAQRQCILHVMGRFLGDGVGGVSRTAPSKCSCPTCRPWVAAVP